MRTLVLMLSLFVVSASSAATPDKPSSDKPSFVKAFQKVRAVKRDARQASAELSAFIKDRPTLRVFHEGVAVTEGLPKAKVINRSIQLALVGGAALLYHAGHPYLASAALGVTPSSKTEDVMTRARKVNTATIREAMSRAKTISASYTVKPEQLERWERFGLIEKIEPEEGSTTR
jgi:hypothetical protein